MPKKTNAELEKELKELKAKLKEAEEEKYLQPISEEEKKAFEEWKEKQNQPAITEDDLELVARKEREACEKRLEELKAKQKEEMFDKSVTGSVVISPNSFDVLPPLYKNAPKAKLFKKLSMALAEVKRIEKSGWNSFHKYKYAQEGDILDGIRPILAEVGLALWTSVIHQERVLLDIHDKHNPNDPNKTKKRWMTKIAMEFTIACTDTGETMTSTYFGEGEDEADKGLYKAMTGATKYFLTKTFLISSGDILNEDVPSDPEFHNDPNQRQIDQHSNQRGNNNSKPPSGQKTPQTPPQTPQNPPNFPEKKELVEVWKKLGGTEADFEPFYTKQMGKGHNHQQLLSWLENEVKKKQNEGKEPPKEESKPAPPEKEKLDVDSMTPEEYLAHVEETMPFPLTPSEKEEILENARNGVRTHK